jgi:hypothetical protein
MTGGGYVGWVYAVDEDAADGTNVFAATIYTTENGVWADLINQTDYLNDGFAENSLIFVPWHRIKLILQRNK